MNKQEIWKEIDAEMKRAKKKFPVWPDHIVSRAAIVCEESGELLQASLDYKYNKKQKRESVKELMKQEAIQVAVTAIRFLENLK